MRFRLPFLFLVVVERRRSQAELDKAAREAYVSFEERITVPLDEFRRSMAAADGTYKRTLRRSDQLPRGEW